MQLKKLFVLLLAPVAVLLSYAVAASEDLAKQSQNPIGDLISLPIEFWHYEAKDVDAGANLLVVKPVYPVNLGNTNLINRFILPYLSVDAGISDDLGKITGGPQSLEASGLGNLQYQALFTPAKPGKAIWGGGPVFEFPTHSDSSLGSDKVSAGLAVLVLTMPGKWVVGMLAQNIWSIAGDSDAPDVNKFTFQYFINYNLDKGWYLTTTPIITADWVKDSDDRWTVPWGGGVGHLVKFGKQPVDFKLQGFAYSEGNFDWSVMFATKFLFPK